MSGFYGDHSDLSFSAGADLSSLQGGIVEITGDLQVGACTTRGGGFGVLVNHPKSGEAAQVGWQGVVKCLAGAAIVAGDPITANSSSYGINANSAATSAVRVLGRALNGCSSGQTFALAFDRFTIASGQVA